VNYFNYFTEIEDAFVRRRGKHLLLSPLDWSLIETWKQVGVPLHVVLRGIERAFDSWESRPRKRTVKSLLYCQEEVEAQFAEWTEARVGSGDKEATEPESNEDQHLPFSRLTILEHLQLAKQGLLDALIQRRQLGEDSFSEALNRSGGLLQELIDDFAASASPDARRLEDSLTGLERMLSDSLKANTPPDQLEAVRRGVVEQLRPYRTHMEKAVYQQTLDNLLLKRLREQFSVPRLSLFYL
jgi:hypothetical protein